jgi:copper homeostasis protein
VQKTLLEVIACSVSDALEAQKGGAARLEVVSHLELGGLTPKFDLVREIKQAVDLPLRVMLRESAGYDVKSNDEFDKLCTAARDFEALGIDGLVLGFLDDGKVNVELTARILTYAPIVKVTFHHAFEDASEKLSAISAIKSLPQVDRILSHGGPGDLNSRIRCLSEYQRAATPKFEIIAGGGIDSTNISIVRRATGISEFHVGRAARDKFEINGEVRRKLVAGLVQELSNV